MTPESRLTQAFVTGHAAEAARELELLPAPDAAALLAPLPPTEIAGVLAHHVPYAGARVLEALPREQVGPVLAALPTAEALSLLRSIAPELREALLGHLSASRAAGLQRALDYRDGTAGALADPFVLTVAAAGTAGQALERIRREPERVTYYLYVLESGARLVGVATLKMLLTADPERSLGALAHRPVATLPAEAGLEDLLRSPHWRAYHILPVVQGRDAFVGALRLRTLHALEHARQAAGTEGLADTLLQLWELYSMAGLGLMTGIANSLDAITTSAAGGPGPAPGGAVPQPPDRNEREEGP